MNQGEKWSYGVSTVSVGQYVEQMPLLRLLGHVPVIGNIVRRMVEKDFEVFLTENGGHRLEPGQQTEID